MSFCFTPRPGEGALIATLLAALGLVSAASAQASALPTLTLTITKVDDHGSQAPRSRAPPNVVSSATGVKEATPSCSRQARSHRRGSRKLPGEEGCSVGPQQHEQVRVHRL